MDLPDFLTADADGDIRLTGHRIGLYHVISYANLGYSPEMLRDHFPTLDATLIKQVLDFREQHRDEVDAYVAEYQAEIDRQRAAAPPGPSFAELRRRIANREQERAR